MRKLLVLAALLLPGLVVAVPATAEEVAGRTFTVQLVPGPSGDQDASGTAVLTINVGLQTLCYVIEVSGIDQPQEPAPGLGSAHIHRLPGGGIAVDLETTFVQTAADTFVASGCVTVDRATLIEILMNPKQFYVNVHTAAFPGGAVQGFLSNVPVSLATGLRIA